MYRGNQDIDSPAELESQFLLRLPEEPARILREAIHNNSTLKDRFAIKVDNDMRHGEVRVDHYLMNAKVVDLPTIVESLKTIDSKGFYKTADICQMLICKEEDDQTTTDDDSPQKTKKKDPNKVDKKYLWPHGITPPSKNVRKRRFRKTLKKKYVEAPEIEKEVKRLLRSDNDAVSVKWEVINEDDENRVNKGTVVIKKEPVEANNQNVAEHDIFGGAVSDSEEEDAHLNVLELDENSQNSAEDSHLTDSNSVMNASVDSKILTEFSSDMFAETQNSPLMDYYHQPPSYSTQNLSKNAIESRLEDLEVDLADLKARRQQQELEIENLENLALRQRFQDILDRLLQEQLEKEQEQYDLQELLKHAN
ncbi:hypothetical protein ILUMI_06664 [Ignelater luminosus]|uniref:TAFII55 protein conserved region domain-containing protein n=1 Tax=Ignelater luminosus TaxID=2038154 RepID=A0A8K0GHJ0_IGNLU|nr:hypothetical protein ILUMI_06664 [Ignelater luminosus]